MKTPYDEIIEFQRKHPEFYGREAEILSTYIACQEHNLKGRIPSIQEAYDHIFVGGCKWCQKELKIAIEYAKKFEEGKVSSY